MARKSSSRRKGISRGFQRGQINKKVQPGKQPASEWIEVLERGMERLVIITYGIVMRICFKLNVVPFKTTPEGLYMVKSKKQVLAYNIRRLFWGLIMLYRTGVTIKVISQGYITASALLTVFESLSYFCVWIVSFYGASDAVVLLKNFNMILSYLKIQRGRDFLTFADVRISFEAFSTGVMMGMTMICFALVNGMMTGGLPTSWVWLADGWIDISARDWI